MIGTIIGVCRWRNKKHLATPCRGWSNIKLDLQGEITLKPLRHSPIHKIIINKNFLIHTFQLDNMSNTAVSKEFTDEELTEIWNKNVNQIQGIVKQWITTLKEEVGITMFQEWYYPKIQT